jgi:hypothetical protein
MVRAVAAVPCSEPGKHRPRVHGRKGLATARLMFAFVLIAGPGCTIVPRSRMDECQRLAQTLRSENARLKDRYLAVQGQNRDYAERAVDDGKRLTIQDEAIERLEHSVQAYQDERTRLEAAYHQLATSLGVAESTADGRQSPAVSKSAPSEQRDAPATARRSKSPQSVDESEVPH